MLLTGFYKIPTGLSLLVILGILSISFLASLTNNQRTGMVGDPE
jgi:hypothetical protein